MGQSRVDAQAGRAFRPPRGGTVVAPRPGTRPALATAPGRFLPLFPNDSVYTLPAPPAFRSLRPPQKILLLATLLLASAPVPALHSQRVLGTAVAERPVTVDGDFSAGDAVRVTIAEEPELSGEFRVDETLSLDMVRLGTMSLVGLSRAQARAQIEERVRRVVRAPGVIVVQPLIRIAVLGSVGKPGFYQYPTSASLPDALTEAGGPAGNADLDKVEIERGNRTLIDDDKVSQAITQGWTLDQLGLRSGDRIDVGEETQRNIARSLRDVAYGVGAIVTLVALFSRVF